MPFWCLAVHPRGDAIPDTTQHPQAPVRPLPDALHRPRWAHVPPMPGQRRGADVPDPGDAQDWLSLRRAEILRDEWLPPAAPRAAPVTDPGQPLPRPRRRADPPGEEDRFGHSCRAGGADEGDAREVPAPRVARRVVRPALRRTRRIAQVGCGRPNGVIEVAAAWSAPARPKVKAERSGAHVALPPHLLPVVKEHIREHAAMGRDWLLFPAAHGEQLAPSTLYQVSTPPARRPDARTFGSMTCATPGPCSPPLRGRPSPS